MHTLPPEDSVLVNDPISSHKEVNPLIILSKIPHVPPINSVEPELSSELLLFIQNFQKFSKRTDPLEQ